MTIGEWLVLARARLEAAGIEAAALEAQLLAAHVIGGERIDVLAHPERGFPELAGEAILQRRERREPLAYILGWREFYGRRIRVTPAVLIPRQETEILVDEALGVLRDRSGPAKVLDLGVGSGCIAITLALEVPGCLVTGADLSAASVAIAEENADWMGASVRLLVGDGFLPVAEERFDLIVSNPPYVGRHETLSPEVGEHEPEIALYAGNSGLEFYEMLSREAGDHLEPYGSLMVEVGYTQAEEIAALFESAGWSVQAIQKDLSGIDRVVVVEPLSV